MSYSLTQWPYEVGLTQKVFAINEALPKGQDANVTGPYLSPCLEVCL